jgi:hypothetical protein
MREAVSETTANIVAMPEPPSQNITTVNTRGNGIKAIGDAGFEIEVIGAGETMMVVNIVTLIAAGAGTRLGVSVIGLTMSGTKYPAESTASRSL